MDDINIIPGGADLLTAGDMRLNKHHSRQHVQLHMGCGECALYCHQNNMGNTEVHAGTIPYDTLLIDVQYVQLQLLLFQ